MSTTTTTTTDSDEAILAARENDPRLVLRTFNVVMDDELAAEFFEAYDAAIATLGLLAEDARDKDALDLLAVLRHLTSLRAHVRAGQLQADGWCKKFSGPEGGAA